MKPRGDGGAADGKNAGAAGELRRHCFARFPTTGQRLAPRPPSEPPPACWGRTLQPPAGTSQPVRCSSLLSPSRSPTHLLGSHPPAVGRHLPACSASEPAVAVPIPTPPAGAL
ncbi:hypothetical protein GCM10022403_014900 [Streptomyces coacervatus]|uniref:Uncharacterized protein n=1 Tax=Streptomyces coacervatus TaxID=647381 RepID=A0ABP7H8D1_9ACTN